VQLVVDPSGKLSMIMHIKYSYPENPWNYSRNSYDNQVFMTYSFVMPYSTPTVLLTQLLHIPFNISSHIT
jgi:hypothetical protein